MQSAIQKPFIFAAIVLIHGVVVFGLARLRPHVDSMLLPAPLTVRLIAQPQEPAVEKPIEVKTLAPNITVEPPDVVIELPALVEPSERAITIPVHAAMPVVSNEDRTAPKLVSTVEYLREPMPRYPAQSRKLREQGLVMLRVMIDERGVACSIEVESSSGHARLDLAAREAVSRAAFKPYVEDGTPRRAMVLIPIEFSLNRTPA
jgi:periplasmic protein TonB